MKIEYKLLENNILDDSDIPQFIFIKVESSYDEINDTHVLITKLYTGKIVGDGMDNLAQELCRVVKELDCYPITTLHTGEEGDSYYKIHTKHGWFEYDASENNKIEKLKERK